MNAYVEENQGSDCAVILETAWDLWIRPDTPFGEWQLGPSRASLVLLGPQFDSGLDEHLRVELGHDTQFLPEPDDQPGSLKFVQENIRSLLRLVRDLDDTLPVESRSLWTESGDNFAERLQAALGAGPVQ